MNIVDILILAVLAFSLLAGMHKGFITSLLSTFGFVGSWFGARLVYERIANLALSNTTLMAVLNQYLEPDSFFASKAQAATTVAEVVSGGESAIQAAVSTVSEKISVISKAFEANIRNQAFARLNITTLSDYLDQTIWQAVFHVLAFLLAFIVIYAIVSLLINLLDHVVRFPVLRMFDWLPVRADPRLGHRRAAADAAAQHRVSVQLRADADADLRLHAVQLCDPARLSARREDDHPTDRLSAPDPQSSGFAILILQ